MTPRKKSFILANNAKNENKYNDPISLNYSKIDNLDPNVSINLPSFIEKVIHIPDRLLDLLELAAYIFASDRMISRGTLDAVEYHSWSRDIHLKIKVRDFNFWSQLEVKESLTNALNFMLGDHNWEISFEQGHSTDPIGLFDKEIFSLKPENVKKTSVVLFSGGADSLAGVLELLNQTDGNVILSSHQLSSSAKKTQNALYTSLEKKFGNRIHHYKYECHLSGKRATDETQRSRSFLFSSIAFVLARTFHQKEFYLFENGVTSLNLFRREDLMNSRASRTTHPQTLFKLMEFFSLVAGFQFEIKHNYVFKTKREVFEVIGKNSPELISSTVSCTKASFSKGIATHCGRCFQCIDRRLSTVSGSLEEYDHEGLYDFDLFRDSLDGGIKTGVLDYIRQALEINEYSLDSFYEKYFYEFATIVKYLQTNSRSEMDIIEELWTMYKTHFSNVKQALVRARMKYDDPFTKPVQKNNLFSLIATREYLVEDVKRFAEYLANKLLDFVSESFANVKPLNENDLNEKVGAFLRSHYKEFRSEYPTVSFACANVIPDHINNSLNLIVESKYIRGSTSPSRVTEGIAADLTKYPETSYILFLVYDPEHQIKSDRVFSEEIHLKKRNKTLIVR
ncbi:hypothetical protein IQB76_05675 [Leptospira borgpetersenii serovar Hardjo-bovis]|uniref:PD-(D/E)XK nuclease domain-containing protein n=2 Tax=Leptospira borgpetersenii TaxID=174 RepID=UPI0000E5778C|nr:hypothetical protein [Leptospira borgpetersenii]ABJ78760.1 Hypothetical protein LBL_1262 [Leptospira borgpetersenii serovar Hardjo-bovis str. L550]AMX58027.1 hypothetical protein LBK6_06630 [Leptospira borgpetersenii serovar Hardjo]AMX61279.1 hypothetical protein LBK9_06655 [Leptospira borgpetersenii serovar Hardjo]AMX64524.1 hypothetical protein LBK30_06710 [Leptospira borgpetersenii serovar Hardjo]AMX67742.1 hypothetical protein LBHA_06575 [Leptospira borgpetersenii serovar Hardjo]